MTAILQITFISVNENLGISSKITLQFVLNRPINNKPALVQMMSYITDPYMCQPASMS